MIKIGDKLPNINLPQALSKDEENILSLVGNKKVIIFGVPGAYVPGCSKIHLRGFLEK